MKEELDQYLNLLKLSYPDAVADLLEKYGPAKVNYYDEQDYQNFIIGQRKSLRANPDISRTGEGLYCHHIDELHYLNLANKDYIIKNKYPYTTQGKTRLVYCNLIEHAILHALIAMATNKKFGYPGLVNHLKPQIDQWYINEQKPSGPAWQINCYQAAYLSSADAFKLMIFMKELVGA